MSSLVDLGASLDSCIYHIGQALSAIDVTRADAGLAGAALSSTTDGSVDDRLAEAMTAIATTDQDLESIAHRYLLAVEKIREYKSTKGIG